MANERPTDAGASGISRRTLLRSGVLAAGAVGVAGAGFGAGHAAAAPGEPLFGADTVPFYGPHQGGIDTPPQAHAAFVGLDLKPGADRQRVIGLMKVWSQDAGNLAAGRTSLTDAEPELTDLPSRLTVTFGFGPRLFEIVGLVDQRPSWLHPLPAYPIDRLDPAWGQTDLLMQVCSEDPITLAHVQRELIKNVRSLVEVKWVQYGFARARGTEPENATMRNLFGQLDGTENPRGTTDFDQLIWDDGARWPWLAGGSSLVIRRIHMDLDEWDKLDRPGRDMVLGRHQDTGAPLGGTHETDPVDINAIDDYGIPVLPPNSHVARSHRRSDGERFLRRAYNYDLPPAPGQVSDTGLIFAAYQRDIDAQFAPIQMRLAHGDSLNNWTTPIGSSVFVLPPGAAEGDYVGSSLLA